MDIFQFSATLAPKIALKCKKNYTEKIAENPPSYRGKFDIDFKKKLKLFLHNTMAEFNKVPHAKIFVTRTIFTPKIAQKIQKMANRKYTPGVKWDRFWI